MTKNLVVYIKPVETSKGTFNKAIQKFGNEWWTICFNKKETNVDLNNYTKGFYDVEFDSKYANPKDRKYTTKNGVECVEHVYWIADPDVTITPHVKQENNDLPF